MAQPATTIPDPTAPLRLKDAIPDGLEFSILISLVEPRGVLERTLEGWCSRQRFDRSRYEVVVAGQASDEDLAIVSRCLGDDDRHVAPDAANPSTQWCAAADAARGRWLVFSEAHGMPAPDFLDHVARRAADTDVDVVGIASPGTRRGTLEWLDQQFVDGERERRRGVRDAVCPRGFAIRRSTYRAAGGMVPEIGSFAVPLFARELANADARLAWAPDAVIVHQNIATLDQPEFCVSDYISGEFRWRASVPELLAWQMFGAPPIWSCRGDTIPRHARAAAQALLGRAACRLASPSRTSRGQVIGETVRAVRALAPAMVAAARVPVRKADGAARASKIRLGLAHRDARGVQTFFRHWITLADAATWHCVERAGIGPPASDPDGDVVVDSRHLFGLSPPERIADRWVRRVRGVSGMALPGGLDGDAVEIRVEPSPGPGELLVFWNGRLIGGVATRSGAARLDLPARRADRRRGPNLLVLVDDLHPLPCWGPSGTASPAPREHGGIVWVDAVVHGPGRTRTFTVSPSPAP